MAKVGESKGELQKQVYNLASDPEVQAQIDALINEGGPAVVEETAPVAEPPAPVEPPAPSATGAVAEVDPAVAPETPEAPEAPVVPEDYFGYDLSDIPEEARPKFIDELKERDTLINRLLRERAEAEARPPAEAPAPPEAVAPITDEDILVSLGQDPEMLDESTAKALVTLGRELLATKEQVSLMAERSAVQETQFYWESNLDKLEAQFGALPIPRDGEGGLFDYAIKHVINDPVLAYWAIVGPTRAEVGVEVKKYRTATAEAKRAAATQRPATSADLVPAALQSTDTKSATKEAALQALKALGLG